jgi:hypothetical protein
MGIRSGRYNLYDRFWGRGIDSTKYDPGHFRVPFISRLTYLLSIQRPKFMWVRRRIDKTGSNHTKESLTVDISGAR